LRRHRKTDMEETSQHGEGASKPTQGGGRQANMEERDKSTWRGQTR
jgi:hypothetical protein